MHSPLSRSSLVSVVLLLALRWTVAAAEPAAAPAAAAPDPQAAARKLTKEAIAPEPLRASSNNGARSAITAAPEPMSARAREDQLRSARYFKGAGYAVLGLGAALAATIVAASPDDGEVVFYASAVAVVLSVGGMGLVAYGERQQRAAQQVAWAPVIGPGFAGVAWSGVLP